MSQPILNIPFAYRALFFYFEPFGVLVGALLLHFRPLSFLNAMALAAKYAPDNQIIYDQLAATYTLFAGVLVGILLCDAIHLFGSWAALGGTVFWDPRTWRPEDWVNLVSLWGQAAQDQHERHHDGVPLNECIY
ncbi:hypothetical protein BGZ61DRAFT_500658 [Ilyonectria robusta]|uniref:uncharacterized protein n=1 Tax=Ilyonectria robusta TaxID=1079257 RepID=UPI001E8CA370|nr:uncharacterized protein BGZ61DRAFT_500658 [Ilyonectria robusta]KAH8654167.1 hypothetical protein BGZ61DRAFT_500658 [Ilyonectria robusta]